MHLFDKRPSGKCSSRCREILALDILKSQFRGSEGHCFSSGSVHRDVGKTMSRIEHLHRVSVEVYCIYER